MKALTQKVFLSYMALLVTGAMAQVQPESDAVQFFEKRVRPVLAARCYACHSAETKPAGGLRVDDRNGLLTGGDSGPAVVPGEPEKSLLIERVRHSDRKRRMPKEGDPVTDTELADLTTWIREGVAWPAEKVPEALLRPGPSYEKLKSGHWAFKPLTKPEVPVIANRTWPWNNVDRFILAKLEEKNLTPVRDADPTTLIRRATFDLTGLPPTPAEIDAFVADKAADAFERLVDRLLQSPRFGERWGRHWLDVARYGESSGPSRNIPYPHAWRYRDYVIEALNRDIPFDRFLQEQIAGDLLPATTPAERDRLSSATGFLALGPKDVNQRFKERFQMDNVDEKIDTVTRSALAMTVSCARCHNHKFDPIPTADYYSMAGIFTSTEDAAGVRSKMGGSGFDYYEPKMLVTLESAAAAPPVPAEKIAKLEAEVAVAKKEWESIRGTPEGLALGSDGKPKQLPYRVKYEELAGELLMLTDPASRGYAVHGVREAKHVADTAIRIRGQAERVGPTVPRGFLTAFDVPGAPHVGPAQSGRLELAQWLTNARNPLTARVFVNRVWHHLFGKGIVTTVDNFGVTGDRPSHPELLDYLASEFIREGWSTKKLVKTILLSRAYRLSADAPAHYREVDPANRLLWRHSPRRLEAEEMRDAILATTGRLQLEPPIGSPAQKLKMVEMRDDGPEAIWIKDQADQSRARSIYLPLLRGVTPRALEAFDPVTQTLVTGQRETTTVPTQALFALNSSFVRRQSLALAEQLFDARDRDAAARIRQAYRLTLNRLPNSQEVARAEKFLATYAGTYRQSPPDTVSAPSVQGRAAPAVSLDQEDERAPEVVVEETIQPKGPQEAAWMGLVQALYASAEFRFIR